MGIEAQLFSVLLWLGILKLLQLSIWPLLSRAFGEISYPLSGSIGLLALGLLTWYLGLLRFPILLAMLPFLLLLALHLRQGRIDSVRLSRERRWDAVFFGAFLLMLCTRFVNPSISFAEKFMDHAFLASVMRNPVVPPLDPWYAGGTLDMYYYLGYWIFGAMGAISGIPSTVVFNLILPTVFSLCILNAYAFGCLVMERHRWLPALTFVLFNPAFLIGAISLQPVSSLLWNSTRVINGTINEYPLFSFLWGDAHPHVMGMFNQVLLVVLLATGIRDWHRMDDLQRSILAVCCGISLGSVFPLNSWDLFVYAPLLLLFALLLSVREKRRSHPWDRIPSHLLLLLVPLLGVLCYLPYYLDLNAAGILGIFPVDTPSEPLQFLLVHGFFLAILYREVLEEIEHRPWCLLAAAPFALLGYWAAALVAVPLACLLTRRPLTPVELTAIAGLAAILVPEVIYLKDSFGAEYFRLNTVFKLYSAGWILLGLSSLAMLGKRLTMAVPRPSPLKASSVIIVVFVLLVLGISQLNTDYGYGRYTLDGAAYLERLHPEDARALDYLRSIGGHLTIVEAEGHDYSYYSRISSFTGIPTIIGWPGHEVMWRGAGAGVGERTGDVRSIYEDPSRSPALLAMYEVDLVYAGELERERYRISLPEGMLEEVYRENATVIYRVRQTRAEA